MADEVKELLAEELSQRDIVECRNMSLASVNRSAKCGPLRRPPKPKPIRPTKPAKTGEQGKE